jgi:hypothetical protein
VAADKERKMILSTADKFLVWLNDTDAGNEAQRERLAKRMAKIYEENPEHWKEQGMKSLFDEAQW